jgi:hypothetical protein
MTYLKSTLIASALTAASASMAFAGDHMKKDHDKDAKIMTKTTVTSSSNTPEVRGVVNTNANDTIGEVLQADGQPDTQSDFELLTHDGDMLTKTEARMMDSDNMIENNAIAVPSNVGAITTVNCPIGTTAQPDMTCLVTGNYDMEKSENLRKLEISSDTRVMGAVSSDENMSTWKKSDWDKPKTLSTTQSYDLDAEYKGTLRPDTVVVSNID